MRRKPSSSFKAMGSNVPRGNATAHGRVQAEPIDVGAQRLLEVCVPGHRTLKRQKPSVRRPGQRRCGRPGHWPGAACKAARRPATA